MNPWTLLIICGVAVVGFAVGRITTSRPDTANDTRIEHAVHGGNGATSASYTGASGSETLTVAAPRNRSGEGAGSSQRFVPVKSTTELRDELRRLQGPGRTSLDNMKERLLLRERLETSNVEALVQEFAQGTFSQRDMQGMNMLFTAMAEKDPERAWNHAMTLPTSMRNAALSPVIIALAGKFPDAAKAKIASVESASLRDILRGTLITTIAKDNPAEALKELGTPKPQETQLVSEIFREWSQMDMKAAQQALQGLDDRAKARAVGAIAGTMAETDPAAAWKFASENATPLGGRYGGDPRYQVLAQWMRNDPKAALEAVASVEEAGTRSNLLTNAFRSWADTDYDAAFRHAMSASDPNVLSSGLAALAGTPDGNRPELLKAILEKVPAGNQFQSAVFQLMNTWARDNPKEAAAAVLQLPPGNTYSQAVSQIAREWMQQATNKNEPLQWALALPDGDTRSSTLSTIFGNWSSSDPAAAAAAAMKLSNEERNNVLYSIANAWGQKDSQAALKWAATLPPDQRQSAINATINAVAANDPKKAISMLSPLGLNGDVGTIGTIVSQWTSHDITAASNWVRQLPNGDIRDNSLGTVARRLAGDEPESAVAWALAIANPSQRVSTIESIVRQWKRYDPQGAADWVARSNLPESSKDNLLR